MGERIMYIRVSTSNQSTSRQEQLIESLQIDKAYIEKMSGKDSHRPELAKLLEYIREGDTLIVESFSRLARSTRDLLDIVEQLEKKGVKFISHKEQIQTDTPTGRFFLTVIAALSSMEREVLLERQAEGIAIRKAAGLYTGGKPKFTDWVKFKSVYNQWKAGKITAVAAQKLMNMTASTYYRRVAEFEKRGE